MNGKFIVFEGIDGTGKTTQILKAISFLSENYKPYEVFYAKEPTYCTESGLMIRKKLVTDKDPKKQGDLFLKLYVKDRAEHCEKIILPAIRYGSIVLCDRYCHSTFAYQQAQGVSFSRILQEHKKYKILKPNLTLIFDLPAKKALKRMEIRSKKELFEKTSFLEEVRKNYLDLKHKLNENIKIIDSSKSEEKIFKEVRNEIEELLKQ